MENPPPYKSNLVLVCTHSFKQWGVLRGINDNRFIPKFRHIQECHLEFSDYNYSKISHTTVSFRTSNKAEAFLIYCILKSKRIALLHIKNEKQTIRQLAELKIKYYPDIKIPIIHRYLNKIPKKHFVCSKEKQC